MNNFYDYVSVLQDGCTIEFGRLSISYLPNYLNIYGKKKYQVHCDDYRCRFSDIYENPGEAVEKFLEIMPKVRPVRRFSNHARVVPEN